MWARTSQGKYLRIEGSYSLKISPESNSIRLRANFENCLYAYVIGDFNNWRKDDKFKLEWKPDPNDGRLKLTKDFLFIDGLHDGVIEYTFLIVTNDGDDLVISQRDGVPQNLSFKWKKFIGGLEIKSSEDVICRGIGLDLAAVRSSIHGCNEVADVVWIVEPHTHGIHLRGDHLIIDENLTDLTEITIEALHQASGLRAKRIYQVVDKSTTEGTIVHFIRLANDYTGNDFIWNCWLYNQDGQAGVEHDFTGNSDYGKTLLVNHDYLIARKKTWGDNWRNDWAQQTSSFSIPKNVRNCYIIDGDSNLYTELHQVIVKVNPRIESAIMDDASKIMAYLSHEPLIGTEFYLYINSERQTTVNTLIKDEKKQAIFTNLPVIQANDLVEIRSNTTFTPCRVLMRNYLDNFNYMANDLGLSFAEETLQLKLWAPTASRVELLLYKNWDCPNDVPQRVVMMHYSTASGIHEIKLLREHNEGKYYLYRLYFDDINRDGEQFTRVTYAYDPYAHAVGLNSTKGALIDITAPHTYPKEWQNIKSPSFMHKEDAIIYEAHVRDFSIDPNIGIAPSLQGKFLGIVEDGSSYTINGVKIATGLASLCELGVTHIHLLPIFNYASVDESRLDDPLNRNWGYDPRNYNVPEGSYSLNPYDPLLRIIELRTMVHKLHQAGLRVVMDMVYNHLAETSNMDNIVPSYYFRSDKYGHYTNGSGCGNELASERSMVRKFILDSIRHWIIQYKIDGLRLDLMELMDFDTMQEIVKLAHQLDPSILIYGEPWRGGETTLTNGTYRGMQKGQKFAIFNDSFRDALRGNNDPSKGFINGNPHEGKILWSVIEGIKGSTNSLTTLAHETINYVDAHDNYTLWDQLEKSQNNALKAGEFRQNIPNNPLESSLVRQNILGLGILLTSQGIPFFQGGAEFLRTKQGDHNSYKSNDQINALHWADKAQFYPVFNYIKGLIALRKQHPAFRMSSASDIQRNLQVAPVNNDTSGVIYACLNNFANNDSWQTILVIYNASSIDNYDVNASVPSSPSGTWHIVVNHECSGTETLLSVANGQIPPLKSYSMLVLHS
ncbi:MAG: hypothetical protein RLZZ293_1305 [Pseudomonadota bacterium]|jgi:pullulanase